MARKQKLNTPIVPTPQKAAVFEGPLGGVKKLTDEDVAQMLEAGRKAMREHEQDRKDRRCLTGKYAPETGTCGVCKGKVVGDVTWHHSDRIGGPPGNAYVKHWHCEGCGILYKFPPNRARACTLSDEAVE
jgi:hypothetical protein